MYYDGFSSGTGNRRRRNCQHHGFCSSDLGSAVSWINCRSEHSIAKLGFRGNLWSILAFETGVLLLAAVLFLPGLQVLFAVADLNLRQLVSIVALAVIPTVVIQAGKMIREALA